MILVGNKIDKVDDRKISETQAREMAKEHNMTYYEASAMENINIDLFMGDLMQQVYQQKFSNSDETKKPTFKLKDQGGSTDGRDGKNGSGNKKCCK